MRHRRRECPIAANAIVQKRLQASKISSAATLYDETNAFTSLKKDAQYKKLEQTSIFALPLLKQYVNEQILCHTAIDGDLIAWGGTGAAQGGPLAADLFRECRDDPMDQYESQCAEQLGGDFKTRCRVTGVKVDMALHSFVDDLCQRYVVSSVPDFKTKTNTANKSLGAVLEPLGIAQNLGKQKHLLSFWGRDSQKSTREAFLMQKWNDTPCDVAKDARYLGPQVHRLGLMSVEVRSRIRLMHVAWRCMGKFWHCKGPDRVKKIVFRALFFSVGASGLAGAVLGQREHDQLDKVVLRYARSVMSGDACEKKPTSRRSS